MNEIALYIRNKEVMKGYPFNSTERLGNFLLRPICWILNANTENTLFRTAFLIAAVILTPLTLLGLAFKCWGGNTNKAKFQLEALEKNKKLLIDKLYYPVIRREFLSTFEPAQFAELDRELDDMLAEPSWSHKSILGLNNYVSARLPLIVSNSRNPDLAKKLLALSNKIGEEFPTPEGHVLAFEVACYAQGIRGSNEVLDMLEELKILILLHLTVNGMQNRTKADIREDLAAVSCVSRDWRIAALKAVAEWLNRCQLSVRVIGCRNIQEGIRAHHKMKLQHAKLMKFKKVSQEELNEFATQCRTVVSLSVKLNQEIIGFQLAQLTNLKSLTLRYQDRRVSEDINYIEKDLAEALSSLKLRKLHILWSKFTGEHLKKVTLLSSLSDLSLHGSSKISEENLTTILSNSSQLEEVDLGSTQVNAAHLSCLPKTHLKKVGLSATSLKEEEIRDFLADGCQIEQLDLYHNDYVGEALATVLPDLQYLTRLDMRCAHRLSSPSFYTALAILTNLKKLDLSCGVTLPDTFTALTSLASLTALKCSNGKICKVLPAFTSLIKLDISAFDVNCQRPQLSELQHISKITNLRHLVCSKGEKWGPILFKLNHLKSLSFINGYPEREGLPTFTHLTQLQRLGVRPFAKIHGTKHLLALRSLAELRLYDYETRDSKPEEILELIRKEN